MLICYECLRKAGDFNPPAGTAVGKCGVCHKAGNLVDMPGVALDPVKSDVCSVCSEPCLASCPYCKKLVHPFYGFMNKNCGAAHEAVCPEAKAASRPGGA